MANLPADILSLVFKLFAGYKIYTYDGWTEQLVLLAVCQRWRRCALPMLCRSAGFYFEKPEGYVNSKYVEDTLFTDFDRIMTMGHPSLVRYLEIWVDSDKDVFACIRCALKILGGHSPVWTSLHAICIFSTTEILDVDYTDKEVASFSRKSKALVNKIKRMMPNITELRFEDLSNNSIANMFYGKLADSYASNLITLGAHKPISLEDINAFSRLTNLEVDCSNNPSVILPLAYIDTLKCLILRDIPESMQWYNRARNQSNKVVFSNLRILELEYANSTNITTLRGKTVDTPELHFPKLQCLTIADPSVHQLLLSCSVFNSELEVLNMFARITSLKQLSHIRLPIIRHFTLEVRLTSNDSLSSSFDTLCNVAKFGRFVYLKLTIDEAHIDLTGCEAYPPITYLAIRSVTNYEKVSSLVRRLPQLNELFLYDVDTDNMNINDLSNMLGNRQGIAPISSSVEHVDTSYRERFKLTQTAINFTVLLLAALPALGNFKMRQIDQHMLLRIKNKYEAHYPHLANVNVLGRNPLYR